MTGEPLLVLGSQLAEFAEDKDRLDVLAVDKRGEIVLLELRVDGHFRLTDLQALACAAGYAGMPPGHFAGILAKRMDIDEFDEWQPSKRVRIKPLAPGYPKRVLHTVKWLGDVYGMPIEAIQVQLLEDAGGRYQLTFERLLPLKERRVQKRKTPSRARTSTEMGWLALGVRSVGGSVTRRDRLGNPVCHLVEAVAAVAARPAPCDLSVPPRRRDHVGPEIGVLHRLLRACVPATLNPTRQPLREALVNVCTVSHDFDQRGHVESVQPFDDRPHLHAVVRRVGLAAGDDERVV
jgi:hypothetical protein